MKDKFDWEYYTEGMDSKGEGDSRKRALIWNATLLSCDNTMFIGDLDEYRLEEIRKETNKSGGGCIVIRHEMGEPLAVSCDGRIQLVERNEYLLPEEREEKRIKKLERDKEMIEYKIAKAKGEDVSRFGLIGLFGDD